MKKNIKKILAIPMLSGVILLSCNSDSGKTDSATTTTTASDTSTMAKPNNNMSSTPSTSDTSKMKSTTATTNTTKKRGKVSTMMMATAASTAKGNMTADAQGYYNSVETLPTYPGGQAALDQFINNNVEYPADAINNNKEGTVIVSFGLDENGKVMNAKVTSSPMIGDGLEDEALKVINKMPAWTPGMVKGKKVRSRYSLPIKFQLAE